MFPTFSVGLSKSEGEVGEGQAQVTDVESGGHSTMLGGQQLALWEDVALKDGLTALSLLIALESKAP